MATVSPAPPAAGTPLGPGDVSVAVNALRPMLNLDPAHVRELDYLLRWHGREVLGGDEDATLTAATVTAAVTRSRPQVPRQTGPEAEFETQQGAVRVYADHADFKSGDGSVTIRTSAASHSNSVHRSSTSASLPTDHATASSFNGTLTPAQVGRIVSAAQQMAVTPMNAAQVAALSRSLSAYNQSLVTPGAGTQVLSVISNPNGNVIISFNTGNMLVLGPQGRVISSGTAPMPRFNVGGGSFVAVLTDAAGSIALAIFLLVAGILVFRPTSRPVRLLRVYAILKIPLAIVAGVGLGVMGYRFATGIASSGLAATSSGPAATGFIVWGAIIGALGLAFPIALLIATSSQTVRNYYYSSGIDR